ncbi:hypothetical protein ARMSODRAFT_193697 [Armillaria solidipes]|uniref:Uncharacterized protein n=1 Tax=Armillaria solidipes TaxID=1076256 RepID=A0A2H3BD60_9AGAR|nr:hypothetical protein ARMSODRAFT_193697 [Armillaria solidipes]
MVIITGNQIYNPGKGHWCELSSIISDQTRALMLSCLGTCLLCSSPWIHHSLFFSVSAGIWTVHLQLFTIPHFPCSMITMLKRAYLATVEYALTNPFTPSQKQCCLTVDIHHVVDDKPDRFLNVEVTDIQVHLDHL